MRTDEQECSLCNKTFETFREKVTHNCPYRDRDICKKKLCGRPTKDEDSEYCTGHKPKPWQVLEPEVELRETEVPVWEVEINYTYRLHGKVKAEDQHRAKEKAQESFDPERIDEVHSKITQIGTETEIEKQGFKEEPATFLNLQTMEPEKVAELKEQEEERQ